jgi:hypothetical protein
MLGDWQKQEELSDNEESDGDMYMEKFGLFVVGGALLPLEVVRDPAGACAPFR